MDASLTEAFRIAAEAVRIPESQQNAFLEQRCADDVELHKAIQHFLSDLQAAASDGEWESIPQETATAMQTLSYHEAAMHAGDESMATLDDHEQSQVEIACRQFAEAWEMGPTPELFRFIPSEIDVRLREYLVYRLVAIDSAERQRRELPSSEEDYVSQLPEFRRAIHSALTRRSGQHAPRSLDETISLLDRDAGEHVAVDRGATTNMQASVHRYQPVKLHARGGLGEIYLAKDMDLGRLVALKRIREDRNANPDYQDRFVFEAEVTGSLEHPGIVPVYSLSKESRANPYYTMRFIRGTSLTEAIKQFHNEHPSPSSATYNDRAFRQLLRRLIDACNAMHYAHERGVLHRDLKPDNLMLGRYGETLVVDWGLAKLRATKERESSNGDIVDMPSWQPQSLQTQTGSVVGTPAYMSPEQAFGLHDELTPASDVYSLGAILFNMISNRTPIDGKTMQEVVTNVRNGNRRSLIECAPNVPPPLDSICRKAMAKDPEQRYATAVELADELERWMSDDRVEAHADSERVLEKAGRLIRRHRSWTISGALSLLAIALVSTVSAGFIQRARRSEELAKQREHVFKVEAVARYRDSRDAIDQWLVQSSDALRFFPGTQSVRTQLLKLASEDYARLAALNSEDQELELERGRALIRLGDLEQMRGDYEGSRSHYDRAMQLFESTALPTEGEQLATSLRRQYDAEAANVRARIAMAYANEERTSEARERYGEAIERLDSLRAASSEPIVVRYLASAQINLGELLLRVNELDEGRQRLSEGREQWLTLEDDTSQVGAASQDDVAGIARSEELLGRLESHLGRHELALSWFRSSGDRLAALIQQSPDHLGFRDALASTSISAASAYRSLGHESEERQELSRAIESYRALLEAMPDAPPYQENLAMTLTDLGLALIDADRCREARQPLEEARDLVQELVGRYPATIRYQDQLAASLDALGQSLLATQEPELAKHSLAESIQIYQSLSRSFPESLEYLERLAVAQSHLAQGLAISLAEGDADSLKTVSGGFQAALATLDELIGLFPDVPRYQNEAAHVAYHHAWFLHQRGDTGAEAMFQSARDRWMGIAENRDTPSSERLAWLLINCPVDSVRAVDRAVEIATEASESVPDNPRLRCTLAMSLLSHGDVDAAAAVLAKVLAESARSGRESFAIAELRLEQGDKEAAAAARQQAIEWFDTQAPGVHDYGLLKSRLSDLDTN